MIHNKIERCNLDNITTVPLHLSESSAELIEVFKKYEQLNYSDKVHFKDYLSDLKIQDTFLPVQAERVKDYGED